MFELALERMPEALPESDEIGTIPAKTEEPAEARVTKH